MAGWRLDEPTSLAELPYHVTRRARVDIRDPVGSSSSVQRAPWWSFLAPDATFVRVSDETPAPDLAEEVAFLQNTPVEVILANHLFVLLQVATLRLAETPPNLEAAQLVIDTVSAMLGAGGERLGEHVDLYRNALAEIQQAFVRAKTASA